MSQLPLQSGITSHSHATVMSSGMWVERPPLLPALLITSRPCPISTFILCRGGKSRENPEEGHCQVVGAWTPDFYLEEDQSMELSNQEQPHCTICGGTQVGLTRLTQATTHWKMDAKAFPAFQSSP